ncbi:AAA family ATPase [Enterococcus sp. LJL99]
MKKLLFISGPMGIGKSSVSNRLKNSINNCVFLDGDWCWYMNPWVFNEENKKMVLDNIQYLLNSYISNSNFTTIIFCWVMDRQEIIDDILSGLDIIDIDFTSISLISEENKLKSNIQKDILSGTRTEESIKIAIERLDNFKKIDSINIDTSHLSIEETAAQILEKIS